MYDDDVRVKARYILGTDTIGVLDAGIQNENDATIFVFDVSQWKDDYGTGNLDLRIFRKGDENPYPVQMESDGMENAWILSNVDTEIAGKHRAQLTYVVNGVRKKTQIFFFRIAKSILSGETVPDPYDDWLDTLQDMADDTIDKGISFAEDSEAWAVGTKGGTPVSSTDEQYHNNSKYYADSLNDRTSEILTSIQSQIEDWFEDLQETLQVSAHIREFVRTIDGTARGEHYIPLDMEGYTYHNSDIFEVYVNGLALQPEEYRIVPNVDEECWTVLFNFQPGSAGPVGPLYEGDTAMVRVLKANIGTTIDIPPMRGVAF